MKNNVIGIKKIINFKFFIKYSLLFKDFKKKIKKIVKIGISAIILVSKSKAELREKANVLLKFGLLTNTIPVYMLIIVRERKKISF
tara:strand:+ start:602 stop:859 length:258 start_codon:yes stop_codon:yes gene_type:complete